MTGFLRLSLLIALVACASLVFGRSAPAPRVVGDQPLTANQVAGWFDPNIGRPIRAQNDVMELVDGPATFKDMAENIRATGSNLAVLYNLGTNVGDGLYPSVTGNIAVGPDKAIYFCTGQGGAKGRGAVCKVTTDGQFSILHSFDFTTGADPRGGLTLGPDGNFYGTCYGGGKYSTGTIWKMTPEGALTVLWDFRNGLILPPPVNRPPTEEEKLLAYGAYPISPPVFRKDGTMVGVTSYGANQQGGVVYTMTGGAYRGVYRCKPEDAAAVGYYATGLTVASDGAVYGTMLKGGLGFGTVYRLGGGVGISAVTKFDGPHGSGAVSLIEATDKNLYGTCSAGGPAGYGLIYQLTPGGAYKVIHEFAGPDGAVPIGGITQGPDGYLYGATKGGGAYGRGAFYRVRGDGENFQVLHSFAGNMLEGRYAQSAPIRHPNGYWYGTTTEGGAKGAGVVYRIDLIKPDFIYALNWFMNDSFPVLGQTRLWDLLNEASNRGVQVRAMLWDQYLTQNNTEVEHINAMQNGAAILDDRTLEYGSHHQKILVMKQAGDLVAYCGGVDFNPDRISTQGDPGAPLHDVHCRIKGPAAGDLLTIFDLRWADHPKHEEIDMRKGYLVGQPPDIPEPIPGATCTVQIGRTFGNGTRNRLRQGTGGYQFAPNGERTAAKMILHAIGHAKQYIYVEEQYFVDTAPNIDGLDVRGALIKKLKEPGFKHLIVVIPHGSITNMGVKLIAVNQASYRRKLMIDELKKAAPEKVRIFFRTPLPGAHTYVHCKTWIFDDEFAIIGSANTNRRSWTYDSEVVAGICDQGKPDGSAYRLPHRLRMRLWAEHLGIGTFNGYVPSGYEGQLENFDTAVELWKKLPSTARVALYDNIVPEPNHPDGEWNQMVDPDGS